jgi:signal transduction histidine kinase
MSVETRENLYLIFKEAINNVAKHSEANKVDVRLSNSSDSFTIFIKDNGKGINEINKKKGNGLKNIKMRAERISGKAEFENENGFSIKIVTPSI